MSEKKNTTTTLTTTTAGAKQSALTVMAQRLAIDPDKLHKTLKETVFKKATQSEFVTLVLVANEYGLNPLMKELHAFPNKSGGIVPVVGIDGWLKIINRHPDFDGMEVENHDDCATVTIHLKSRKHPVQITEWLEECRRNTEPWKTMPKRMLRHKAIMQAARVAFGISGIVDEDEAADQSGLRNVTPPEPAANPFAAAKAASAADAMASEPVAGEGPAAGFALESPSDEECPVVNAEADQED